MKQTLKFPLLEKGDRDVPMVKSFQYHVVFEQLFYPPLAWTQLRHIRDKQRIRRKTPLCVALHRWHAIEGYYTTCDYVQRSAIKTQLMPLIEIAKY